MKKINRLDELRKEKGLTVTGLCKQLNISRRTYYQYRSGNRSIPSNCLCDMAQLFGVSTDYILGIKNYTHITITDNAGGVLADIGQNDIIEHDSVKVVLS